MFDKWYRSLRVEQVYSNSGKWFWWNSSKTVSCEIDQVLNNQGIPGFSAPGGISIQGTRPFSDRYELERSQTRKPHNSVWESGSSENFGKFFSPSVLGRISSSRDHTKKKDATRSAEKLDKAPSTKANLHCTYSNSDGHTIEDCWKK